VRVVGTVVGYTQHDFFFPETKKKMKLLVILFLCIQHGIFE
jgi:hypothetical protein